MSSFFDKAKELGSAITGDKQDLSKVEGDVKQDASAYEQGGIGGATTDLKQTATDAEGLYKNDPNLDKDVKQDF